MKRIFLLVVLAGAAGSGMAQDRLEEGKYLVSDSVLIHTRQGHTLSATVVRRSDVTGKQPTALLFYLYSNTATSIREAKAAADHGYVGMVADVRGKRLSPDKVEPYENEQEDVYEVIDWITHQPWSNGKVGMYGGSYSGFAQWAGVKHRVHPALKTIVPYVAGIPGQGLPMENNVFINANYAWAFYVTDNKYTDDSANNDRARWNRMNRAWFTSGAAYRKIDSVDGQPNPLLQRWLNHPSYDAYWQAMVPYKNDFSHIHIPVLVFDGYYNDGQCSSLDYLREHRKYYPQADDYLVIGPYDHFGAQHGGTPELRGFRLDRLALIDVRTMTFQWLDYILKGAPKPKFLRDHINYEVMTAGEWKHAPTLDAMHNDSMKLYLTPVPSGDYFTLSPTPLKKDSFLEQTVGMGDRGSVNFYNFPDPIIQQPLSLSGGLAFISEPLIEPVVVSGRFTGMIRAAINKKDMDYSLAFYEVFPEGRYFQFSYYLARASYAQDPTERHLLQPGRITDIPFTNTKITAKQLGRGSRLLVILNVNKNPLSQVNEGTGGDVSDETAAEAGGPLQVKWYSGSYINVPLYRESYIFPLAEGWSLERSDLPPTFSPNVPYEGTEEIHFAPGWGDPKSDGYWTVDYLFLLKGKQTASAEMLDRFLNTYFDGLIADNVPRRHIPLEKVVKVHTGLQPVSTSPGDAQTYTGTIRSLDYLAQVPMTLHCIVHVKTPSQTESPVLVEMSPQETTQPIWQPMEAAARGFRAKR